MTTPSTISNYFAALNGMNRAAYVACFTDDAEVLDPYGGRPLQGTAGLNKFMDGLERTWATFTMTTYEGYGAGDRFAVRWTASATAKSGKTAHFGGINLFTLNSDGLITRLEGYWDFKAMVAQIS